MKSKNRKHNLGIGGDTFQSIHVGANPLALRDIVKIVAGSFVGLQAFGVVDTLEGRHSATSEKPL